MGEAEPEKQRSMVTKSSSIKRKPLADLTNIIRKPNRNSSFVQSKKSGCSTASVSSIGSTQNPVNVLRPIVDPPDKPFPSKPQRFKSGHLAADENQTAQARRDNSHKTQSNMKSNVPFYQSSFQERRNDVKEGSVSIYSSKVDKIKDQGKVNQFCLDKTVNDGKKIVVASHDSSSDKIKDRRKSIDVPLSARRMKNTNNSMDTPVPRFTEKLKDKGKENVVQSGNSFSENANSNMNTMIDSSMKRKDKGKAIAVPLDYPSRKMLKYNMMDIGVPLKGVIIKERESTGTGSDGVKLAQKDEGTRVSTPIIYRTMEKKKNQQSSCPPILKTTSNRNDAGETEDVMQSKLKTEPPPNKKKRRYPTKEVQEDYTLPEDYVEQQRAYFKEIDDFELEVEEV